jgi:hypothetical protein
MWMRHDESLWIESVLSWDGLPTVLRQTAGSLTCGYRWRKLRVAVAWRWPSTNTSRIPELGWDIRVFVLPQAFVDGTMRGEAGKRAISGSLLTAAGRLTR